MVLFGMAVTIDNIAVFVKRFSISWKSFGAHEFQET